MPQPAVVKLTVLATAVAILILVPDEAADRFHAAAVLFAAGTACAALVALVLRRGLHHVTVWVFAALICIGAAWQLDREPRPEEPPNALFDWTAPVYDARRRQMRPNYRHALSATARVTEVLRPGSYIVQLEVSGAYLSRRRDSWTRLVAWSERTAAKFPAHVQMNAYDPVPGCELELWLFGRGRPERLNDGGYHEYLRRYKQVRATLRLSKRYHLRSVDCSRPDLSGLLQQRLRESLERAGLDHRDPRYGTALGMLLGRSGYLSRDFKQGAAELGVLHLFAASGLHLGILYGCLYFPLGRIFGRKHPLALLLPLLPCGVYLYCLGFPVSLLRAYTLLSLHAMFCIFPRRLSSREYLLNAGCIVLLLSPREFVSPGAALSFGAVAGILFFARPLYDFALRGRGGSAGGVWRAFGAWVAGKAGRFLAAQAAVSSAASLFTNPVLILAFGAHAYLNLPANVVLVPVAALSLPLLVFGMLAAQCTEHAAIVLWPALAALSVFVTLCEEFGRLEMLLPPPELRPSLRVPLTLNFCLIVAVWMLRRTIQRRAQHANTLRKWTARAVLLLLFLLGPAGAWLVVLAAGLGFDI